MGIQVSHEEAMDYMHLWNVAGFLIGIDERLLPDTGKEAFLLDKMITSRQFATSEAGEALTASLLIYIVKQADGTLATLAPAYMRYLLGNKVSDLLNIPQSEPGSHITVQGMRALNMVRNIGGYSEKSHYQAYAQLRKKEKKMGQF